jgi:hypothetical protein
MFLKSARGRQKKGACILTMQWVLYKFFAHFVLFSLGKWNYHSLFTKEETKAKQKLLHQGHGINSWRNDVWLPMMLSPSQLLPSLAIVPFRLCKPVFSCLDDLVFSFIIKTVKSSLLLDPNYSDKLIYVHLLMALWLLSSSCDIIIKCFLFYLHFKMIKFFWFSFTACFMFLSVAKVTSQFIKKTNL